MVQRTFNVLLARLGIFYIIVKHVIQFVLTNFIIICLILNALLAMFFAILVQIVHWFHVLLAISQLIIGMIQALV